MIGLWTELSVDMQDHNESDEHQAACQHGGRATSDTILRGKSVQHVSELWWVQMKRRYACSGKSVSDRGLLTSIEKAFTPKTCDWNCAGSDAVSHLKSGCLIGVESKNTLRALLSGAWVLLTTLLCCSSETSSHSNFSKKSVCWEPIFVRELECSTECFSRDNVLRRILILSNFIKTSISRFSRSRYLRRMAPPFFPASACCFMSLWRTIRRLSEARSWTKRPHIHQKKMEMGTRLWANKTRTGVRRGFISPWFLLLQGAW